MATGKADKISSSDLMSKIANKVELNKTNLEMKESIHRGECLQETSEYLMRLNEF
jgi:hypothetical protein